MMRRKPALPRPTLVGAGLILALALALAGDAAAQRARVPRQVAAPAADILSGRLRLPDPSVGAVRCRAALLELAWRPVVAGRWRAIATVPVRRGDVGLAVQAFGARAMDVRLQLTSAEGAPVRVDMPAALRRDQTLGAEFGFEDVQRWDVVAASSGALEVVVDAEGAGEPPRARLAVRDGQGLTAAAYVDAHRRTSDRSFALVARVEREGGALARVDRATATVRGPAHGAELVLRDDGRSGDGAAGDGAFGAWLPAGLSGAYAADVQLSGERDGAGYLRTTRVTFDVVEPTVALTGAARGVVADTEAVRLELDAWLLDPSDHVQVSAEVWGTDERGERRAMAWLSRIQPGAARTPGGAGDAVLDLRLDAGWMTHTGLLPPLELRNVRVQDVATHAVIAADERMPVDLDPRWRALPALRRSAPPLSALAGPTAGVSAPPAGEPTSAPLSPGLMLVHGYCSGGGVWPLADFTGPLTSFLDASQNRTHDEFANLIVAQAAGYSSFGVVGHSQGGAAALHLLTYYTSGLDAASGARRIQSVGTPYQGTPLASLGSFACGVNNDMTPAGAATWLAGIPTWARAEVSYYTTADDGSACQFLTSLLLSDPEDGTTERARGQLPGGVNMGHVTGWCHTTGMSDPPQYRDAGRNGVMDAAAAR